jgi:hypothetical protein
LQNTKFDDTAVENFIRDCKNIKVDENQIKPVINEILLKCGEFCQQVITTTNISKPGWVRNYCQAKNERLLK